MNKFFKSSLVTVILASAGLASAYPHGNEERFAESKYRHDIMELSKYALGNILANFQNKVNQTDQVADLAEVMALAAKMSKTAFEKDTRDIEGFTEAKDKIWENWEDYAARMDTYIADTRAFADVAKQGDKGATMNAFRKAAGNCKACHDIYRD